MPKIVLSKVIAPPSKDWDADTTIEDGGQSLCTQFEDDGQLFVRILSWDETGKHSQMNELVGKKVTVTIEWGEDGSDKG